MVGTWTECLFLDNSLFPNYKGNHVSSLGTIFKLVIGGEFYMPSRKIRISIYEANILRGDISKYSWREHTNSLFSDPDFTWSGNGINVGALEALPHPYFGIFLLPEEKIHVLAYLICSSLYVEAVANYQMHTCYTCKNIYS